MAETAKDTPPHTDPPHQAAAVARLLDIILGDLLRLVNLRHLLFGALHILLSNRISRVRRRIVGLFALLAAGKLPRARAPSPSRRGAPRPAYIPRRRAWLVVKLGHHAAAHASQLQHLLDTPQARAALASAPPEILKSAGRTLRPLARLLGVTLPPALQAPPRPPRAKPPPRPKPAPLPPLLPFYPQRRPRPMPFPDIAPRPRISKMKPG